jgi:hypothetical protein
MEALPGNKKFFSAFPNDFLGFFYSACEETVQKSDGHFVK